MKEVRPARNELQLTVTPDALLEDLAALASAISVQK